MTGLDRLGVGRVVVLGAGNTLRGDDGAGPAVAARLAELFPALSFDGGQAPENYLGPLRRAAPETVVLVDAADFSGTPGEIRVLSADDIEGVTLGTHGAPLDGLMRLIEGETGATTHLVAIQAKNTSLGAAMSEEVRRAVDRLVEDLSRVLGRCSGQD